MNNATQGKSALGLDANIAALLGYIVGIVALISLFIEKDNKFVRFHAIQSLLFAASFVVALIALMFLTVTFSFISSTLGGLLGMLTLPVWLGFMAGIVFFGIKAYQGARFKLPIIGDMAEKWS